MQPQLFLEEIEICDQDGYHKILKDENQTPIEHIFFNAVGGKNACMIIRACMIKSNNIVNDQTLQIKPFLAYEDFQIVNDQNVLEVKELTQDNNGYFTVRFRINEVSSHHQGQKFRLMLTIDNSQNYAISPIFSTPIEVRSKIIRRSFDTELTDSTQIKRVKKMNKTVTFQPTLSFIDPTLSTNPMLSIPLIDMMSIKDITAGVIEQVSNLKKFITVIESNDVSLNGRSIQVYDQCISKILNDMNQLNNHLSKCSENDESFRNPQRQGLSHSDMDDLCKAPILSRQNSQNSYVIPVEYENNNGNEDIIFDMIKMLERPHLIHSPRGNHLVHNKNQGSNKTVNEIIDDDDHLSNNNETTKRVVLTNNRPVLERMLSSESKNMFMDIFKQ